MTRRENRGRGLRPFDGARRRALYGAAVVVVVTWILSRTGRVEVNGASMWPTLLAGDRLLVLMPGGPWRRPRAGDIVVVRDPRSTRPLVKRAARQVGGDLLVAGDNPSASTDSRAFGPVPRTAVTGWAVYRYAPPDRVGRL